MAIEIWFWIIYLIALLFSLYTEYTPGAAYPWPRGAQHLIFFVLVGLLGYKVFGPPIK